jgi:hypothetical protein
MSAAESTTDAPRETLSIEDVKIRAERVRDLATQEARQTVRDIAAQPMTRTVTVIAVALGVGVSLAYFFGSRSGARKASRRARHAAPAPPSV